MASNNSNSFTNSIKKYFEERRINLNNWTKNREIFTKDRTIIYVGLIVVTLYLIGIAGYDFAEKTAPHESSFVYVSRNDPNFELKNFEINFTAKNVDNTRFSLMRQTERLQFDISVKSKYNENVTLKYSEQVFVGAYLPKNTKGDQIIEPNKIKNFSSVTYVTEAGINTVYMDFEFHTYRDPANPFAGVQTPSLIDEKTISYYRRIYTQSEYDSLTSQYYLYYYLWVAASPLVLIGVRALKEIIEDKDSKNDLDEHKIYS